MTDLQRQFQEETKQSFEGIPINGVHLEYIAWLEAQIQSLRIHDVVGRSEKCAHEFQPYYNWCSELAGYKCEKCGEEKE